jgi:ribosomal protein S12 methylthiotransferase accessory factor YcaO
MNSLETIHAELAGIPRFPDSAPVVHLRQHPTDPDVRMVWAQPVDAPQVCGDCLDRKVTLLFESQESPPTTIGTDELDAIVHGSASRGIGLAVTNADVAQSWSLVAPWPDCSRCDPAISHLTALAAGNVVDQPDDPTTGNGLPRRGTARDFVSRHRGLFGFASVLLNPSFDQACGLFTVDTGMFLGTPTVYAPVGGKGDTLDQALASCVGEGLERYCIATRSSRSRLETIRAFPEASWRAAKDFTGATISVDAEAVIEVTTLEPLDGPEPVTLPESLVRAPYTPPSSGVAVPTASSTTGAAAGGTVAEATLQGILELLERDAFWFAARTRMPLVPADPAPVAELVDVLDRHYEVEVVLRWIPNPLSLPVAHCALVGRAERPMAARGMGVAVSSTAALRKSLLEAVQMWRSLMTGVDVAPSDTDMRSLWWSGQAQEQFPAFFGQPELAQEIAHWGSGLGSLGTESVLDALIEHAARHGLRFARTVLADHPSHCVVRVISDRILPLDDLYFPNLRRFRDWERVSGHEATIGYRGPLFM